MNNFDTSTMFDTLRLVKEGQLKAATTALLQRLQQSSAPAGNSTAASPAPERGRTIDAIFSRVHDAYVAQPAEPTSPPPTRPSSPPPTRPSSPPWTRPSPAPSTEHPPGTTAVPGFHARSFNCEFGSRSYKLFIPSRYGTEPLPLLIMLHGCTQNPDDFAIGTRMNALAEERGIIVAYPAQSQTANSTKCWNWFKGGDQVRGQGEPALIAAMTQHILRSHRVDAQRVYVAGLSAGAAMALILATSYPDLYAAVGVHSGLPYASAVDMPSAFAAMKGDHPIGRSKKRGAPSPVARVVPTIVFHGDRDSTVAPVNAERISADWASHAASHDPTHVPRSVVSEGRVEGGHSYTRTVRYDRNDRIVLDEWLVHGAAHAWFGGDSRGSYTDPRGPDASSEMLRFFAGVTAHEPAL